MSPGSRWAVVHFAVFQDWRFIAVRHMDGGVARTGTVAVTRGMVVSDWHACVAHVARAGEWLRWWRWCARWREGGLQMHDFNS